MNVSSDCLFQELKNQRLIALNAENSQWQATGWLKDFAKIRNDIVHEKPFGSSRNHLMGSLLAVNKAIGLYKYVISYKPNQISGSDIFDEVSSFFLQASILFCDIAKLSGYNSDLLTLTDEDIISAELK
jgi:hypothetical protein